MPFKYRAITANCGNDGIGKAASTVIVDLLATDEDPDFILINCQEADFKKTQRQLDLLLEAKGYKSRCLSQMVTHTKSSTNFHSNTGIATFIIYKNNLIVQDVSAIEARRNGKRFSGTAYNKGGLITNFTLMKDDASIRLESISGHLDSKCIKKRNTDWSVIHKASASLKATTWEELVIACPHLSISGYDANTRHKLQGSREINLLMERPDTPEIQGLTYTPFADRHFSSDITYGKMGEDPKRPGYSKRGMLDFVGIADGGVPQKAITTEQIIKVELDETTARDHAVVISPLQIYTPLLEFDVVKNQMASRLHHVAPQLANQIRNLVDSEESKQKLITIYNDYLSVDGVLHKALALHTQKLGSYGRLMQASFLTDEDLRLQLGQLLFHQSKSWCDGFPQNILIKNALMRALLHSLDYCQLEAGIKARLQWYHELNDQMDQGVLASFKQEFKEREIAEYLEARKNFAQLLNSRAEENDNGKKLHQAGLTVLMHLDAVTVQSPSILNHHIDPKALDLLTRIALHCQKACEETSLNSENTLPMVKLLDNLSQEIGARSSLLWRALNTVLKLFTFVFKEVFGVPVKISDDIGITKKQKAALKNSISSYKSAIQELGENPSNSESDKDISNPGNFK